MIKDALFSLSYQQDVQAVTNSQRCVDFQSLADYGVGRPWYIVVQCCGAISKDLRVQIIGSEDNTFSTVTTIADSGVIPTASLVQGYEFKIQVPQVDKKYRFLALRYIPSESGVGSTGAETPSGSGFVLTGIFDPMKKVGEEQKAVDNAVSAFATPNVGTDVDYPQANADKITR